MNKNLYNDFIKKYSSFAKKLNNDFQSIKEILPETKEHPSYNKGTMQRDADAKISPNIILLNSNELKEKVAKNKGKGLSETDKEALAIFDSINKYDKSLSFKKNGNDILFKENNENVSRSDFYSKIYHDGNSNTNYFAKHIGDTQIITLPDNGDKLPRSAANLPIEISSKLDEINEKDPNKLPEIFLKRGLYHEAIHVAAGTNDERKCDTFAMLKIIKEHPKEAEAICEMYSFARSKISYTVSNLHNQRNNNESKQRQIKNGTMTYLMPETYKELQKYARKPELLDSYKSDKDLLKLSYEITSNHEFSEKQLVDFDNLLSKNFITKENLENSEIVKACVSQSGAKDFDEYLLVDKNLKDFIEKQEEKQKASMTINKHRGFDGSKSSNTEQTNPIEMNKDLLQNLAKDTNSK